MKNTFFLEQHFLLSFLSFFCLALTLKASVFDLQINDVSGLDGPWPMVASIAFPEGELKDPSSVRIMSGSREVPSQVDVAATWRDGSIRWALCGFTASPRGKYRVEYGTGVKRGAHPSPLKVTRHSDGGFTIDTGPAIYRFESDRLLPDKAWLVSGEHQTLILENAGAGAYLVDNSGRTARVAGQGAEIENVFLKEGPARLALKRSGWYVTDGGEKLARAEAWFYFSQGVPHVRITHSLIFTEDTNRVWFKDCGLEFNTPSSLSHVYCSTGESGETIRKVSAEGREVYMLQDLYPHFAEKKYRAVIGKSSGGKDTVAEEFQTAGDWAHGDYGNYGITLVMPWLAERFPKEISFGQRGVRAVLWSGRSGRELDFRARTLVEEYWQTWAKKANARPSDAKIDAMYSNAQGVTRTHDMWFLPHTGRYDEDIVKKNALACAKPVLAIADPAWLCSTKAIGWPTRQKDTEKLPEEEKLISDLWTRLVLPLKVFPMNGFISWGCYPDIGYPSVGRQVMPSFGDSRLTGFMDYGLRKAPYLMYARSGERRYYEWGHKFSRFAGDYAVAHHAAKGKEKGAFISGSRGGLPLFWEGNALNYHINDGEIRHWLNDYYLTGDEHSLELVKMVKDSISKKGWPSSGAMEMTRLTLALSIMDWDKDAVESAHNVVHSMIDMESQNALKAGGYGAIYKDHSKAYALAEYYMETEDEFVKTAFLKLIDQRYRFDRRYNPLGHRMYDGVLHSLAYWMTGEKRHRAVVEQTIGDALYYSREYPLEAALSKLPANPVEWRGLPDFLGQHEYHNPFTGFPTAFKLLAEEGWRGERAPVIVKSMELNSAQVIFQHNGGEETTLSFYFTTVRPECKPEVFKYPFKEGNLPLPDVKMEIEKRVQWPERLVTRPDDIYHAFIRIQAQTPRGLYILSLGGNEPFTLLDITTGKAALYCPEGFFSASGSPIRRSGEGAFGRSGEGTPMFFRVPKNLDRLELFLGSPARIRRPDGTVALEKTDENKGRLSIPVGNHAGIWSIEPHIRNFKGNCLPSFFRLLNVEPVVTFGTPQSLPDGTGGKPLFLPEKITMAKEPLEFVTGLAGKAVRLSGGKSLSFNRGARTEKDGWAFFPGKTGTAEFWFRPDLSSHESPRLPLQTSNITFVSAPHINFLHRSWNSSTGITDIQQIELLPDKGNPEFGFQARHHFRAGEWIHIAYTWDIDKGELSIFLNGKKLPFSREGYGLQRGRNPFDKSKTINLSQNGEEIVIGPFEGTMDMLRISDSVRYTQDFTPAKIQVSSDKNTRALFSFDGNLQGISALSAQPVEAK